MPQQRTNKHTSRNSSNKGINYTRTVLDVEEKITSLQGCRRLADTNPRPCPSTGRWDQTSPTQRIITSPLATQLKQDTARLSCKITCLLRWKMRYARNYSRTFSLLDFIMMFLRVWNLICRAHVLFLILETSPWDP